MINIFFLISSLNVGGAERQFVELVKGVDKNDFNVTVGLFYKKGKFIEELNSIPNVKILFLDKTGRWDVVRFVVKLFYTFRRLKPDILYSFMPEANILGLIIGKIAKVPRIVWGIRASNMDERQYNWLFGVIFRLGVWLSRFPDIVIANSNAGHEYHRQRGFKNRRMVVVHNGIDTERFSPDPDAGAKIRAEFGVTKDTTLIGLVARLDPMKGHIIFLEAARILLNLSENVHFMCVGRVIDQLYFEKLQQLERKLGLGKYITWAEERQDMRSIYNAFSLATSSSIYGEGFSNSTGEAMACGVPCVTTDIGDASTIVADTGIVVPANNPQALAEGWLSLIMRLNDDHVLATMLPRTRILSHFSCDALVEKTMQVLSLNMG